MSRVPLATVIGLCGFAAYIAAAVTLADRVQSLHWAIQALYFVLAGVLWVVPAHFLILWAARK